MSGRCPVLARLRLLALLPGLLLAVGCHHRKPQAVVLPQATTPVPLESDTTSHPLLPEPPNPKLPPVPVAEAATKPKKVKKKQTPKPVTQTASGVTLPASVGADSGPMASPGATVASTGMAEMHGPGTEAAVAGVAADSGATTIGALTAGGEQNPKTKQEATDLIASNEKRLSALPAETLRSQASLVSKVKTFQRDAQQALASGDAEGARTLATKGKLLLDDMTKGPG